MRTRAVDERRLRRGHGLVERGPGAHRAGSQVRRPGGHGAPGDAAVGPVRAASRGPQHQQLCLPLRRAVRGHSQRRPGDHDLRVRAGPDRGGNGPGLRRSLVQLFDEFEPASPFFQSVPRWSNLTHANSWTLLSFPVDVTSIAGKEMVFRIVADLDTSVPTYFYFDTVSVTVSGCLP